MNQHDFSLDIKKLAPDGQIEGMAAAYGNVDHGGDVIMPGAMAKSLVGRKSLPMLLFHDQKQPVGVWNSLNDTPDGLMVKGQFAMDSSNGAEAHALTKAGALSGLSIGYQVNRQKMDGKVRQLHDIAVHEASLVSVPMNERAVITNVKDINEAGGLPTVREFEDWLRDAGGFSKSLAVAIATKATPHLRGDPEAMADEETLRFLRGLRA